MRTHALSAHIYTHTQSPRGRVSSVGRFCQFCQQRIAPCPVHGSGRHLSSRMSLRRRLTRTVAADSETLLAARERRAACAPIFSGSVEPLTPFLAHRWHWSFAFPRAPCVFDEELRAFNLMHALHALTSAPLRRTAGAQSSHLLFPDPRFHCGAEKAARGLGSLHIAQISSSSPPVTFCPALSRPLKGCAARMSRACRFSAASSAPKSMATSPPPCSRSASQGRR